MRSTGECAKIILSEGEWAWDRALDFSINFVCSLMLSIKGGDTKLWQSCLSDTDH